MDIRKITMKNKIIISMILFIMLFGCMPKEKSDNYFYELKCLGNNEVELYIQNKSDKPKTLTFKAYIRLNDSDDYILFYEKENLYLNAKEIKKINDIIIQKSYDDIIENYTQNFFEKAHSQKYEITDDTGLRFEEIYEVK